MNLKSLRLRKIWENFSLNTQKPNEVAHRGDKMKKVRIKVTYKSKEIDERADKKIIEIIEHIGEEWYASGYDLTTNIQDICFDYKLQNWD